MARRNPFSLDNEPDGLSLPVPTPSVVPSVGNPFDLQPAAAVLVPVAQPPPPPHITDDEPDFDLFAPPSPTKQQVPQLPSDTVPEAVVAPQQIIPQSAVQTDPLPRHAREPAQAPLLVQPTQHNTHLDAAEVLMQRDALARELKHLRDAQSPTSARQRKVTPASAIEEAVNGGPLRIERFRSVDDKCALLDAAVKSCHGDVIKLCTRFVARTLAPHILRRVLHSRPAACQHLIQWYRERRKWRELIEFCHLVEGYQWAAGIAELELINDEASANKRGPLIIKLVAKAENDSVLGTHVEPLKELLTLAKAQVRLESHDSIETNIASNATFKKFPKRAPVTLTPAITTLYYSIMYHSDTDSDHPGCPQMLRDLLHFSDSEYVWTAVRANIQLKRFGAVDELMTVKSSLFGTKLKPSVDTYSLSKTLLNGGAPAEMLLKYFATVEDPEHRLLLYTKAKAHLQAVQTLIELRDRARLERYYQDPAVIGDFVVRKKALDALDNPKFKWHGN